MLHIGHQNGLHLDTQDPSSEEQHANKRLLTRSTHERDLSKFLKRNDHVMLLVCIVCQRERYIMSANGGWTKDMVTCEGDGELSLKKVKERQDENILHHRRTVGDLESAEIHYHRSCYRNYTRGTDTAVCHRHSKRCHFLGVLF